MPIVVKELVVRGSGDASGTPEKNETLAKSDERVTDEARREGTKASRHRDADAERLRRER